MAQFPFSGSHISVQREDNCVFLVFVVDTEDMAETFAEELTDMLSTGELRIIFKEPLPIERAH